MKHLKKIFVLIVVLMLALTACSGIEPTEVQSESTVVEDEPSVAEETGAVEEATEDESADAPRKIYIGVSIIGLSDEYWAQEYYGAQMFADSLPEGSAEVVLLSNSTDEEQLSNITSFIAAHGEDSVVYVDPLSSAVTVSIAELCEENHVYCTIYAHLADGLYPKDYQYLTVHFTQDDENSGYLMAKTLFDAMGGGGNVVELYGILGTDASEKRNAGLLRALEEYPDITLLDSQVANHSANEALTVTETLLATHGDEIDGIFTHSDQMAIGAIEALKKVGKDGEIFVTGVNGSSAALNAIKEGSMLATIQNNGYLVGGYGAAYSYYAAVGELDTLTMDQKQRMFYTKTEIVTIDNVDEQIAAFVDSTPTFDFTDLTWPIDAIMPQE